MPKYELSLIHELQGDLSRVYEHLFDFTKFGRLHPYMKDVQMIADRSPEYIEYAIIEEVLFFGFIPGRPEYKAKVIELHKNRHVKYTSQVKPNVHLEIDLVLSEISPGQIIVHENITLNCSRIICIIFMDILKKAHQLFFKKLNSELQADFSTLTA